MHRRVARRKPVRRRVIAEVGQPDGPRFGDEDTEHAATVRQLTDLRTQLVVDADGEELREPAFAAGIEDA